MQTYILNIGNELLIGDTINTNASWLGEFFYQHGFDIVEVVSIPDEVHSIVSTLDRAISAADLILITGGLGPTHDDITKKTLANYFNSGIGTGYQTLITTIHRPLQV
jgi:nicotinamide-nucleotide amidase